MTSESAPRLRLLHVTPTADSRSGGPIEALKQRARICRALGTQVDIVSLDPPGMPWLDEPGTPVLPLGTRASRFGYTPRLRPWLREHAPSYDAVIVEGLWQYQSLGTWSALRGTNVPYFVFAHGMLDPWSLGADRAKYLKKRLYWRLIEHRVLRDARAVLFTAEEERRLARAGLRPWQSNDIVVPFGTSSPPGDPQTQIEAFFNAVPGCRGRRFLLFLGRIHPKKGCDLLVDAFAQITASAPDLQLVIAGPDEIGWASELQARAAALGAASRIHWPGMLKGDVKWGGLRAAEALVLPSHQENFGMVVAEALACGTPALLSRRVNIFAEVVSDGAGWAEEDTLDGTRQLLETWISLPDRRRHAAATCALTSFSHRFDLSESTAFYLVTLQTLINASWQRHISVDPFLIGVKK